ncbi:sensor histidine kinase [Tessaracoccus caeni]|uniref:sensor histidine kinase n=1 Tax=Tessaracoccus caeni TaxID=3031239 RepID=UPI0023DBFF2C|nr:ATP-binding protein [Tessaracoccus caeni]MDF1489788.1 histidine kinase [Tessaracoccus caeni]
MFRRPLVQFVSSALLVLFLVVGGSVAWVTWTAREEARDDAADAATSFAQLVVSTLRVAELEHRPGVEPGARSRLDDTVARLIDESHLYRVKIWQIEDSDTARIVYSDLPEIEGKRVPVSRYLREALDTGRPVVLPVPDDEAHATEQRDGADSLEVYLTYEDADGAMAVAELYQTAQTSQRVREMLARTLPVAIGGPVLLAALSLPLTLRLSRRQARAEEARRQSVEHALQASERERRRLARLLHDGPVQDLAALSMALEQGTVPGVALDGRAAAERVRAEVGRLRTLLDDLDPVVENTGDLRNELIALARGIDGGEVGVSIEGDDLAWLDERTSGLARRCSEELLRNALTHARASEITVRWGLRGDAVCVEVVDDGVGFDPSVVSPGHHGLRLVRAAVQEAGGAMSVESGSRGSIVTLLLP